MKHPVSTVALTNNINISTVFTFFLKPLPVKQENGKILGYNISVIGYLHSKAVYWKTHLVNINETSLHLQGMLIMVLSNPCDQTIVEGNL